MALFVAGLAFEDDPARLAYAKVAILAASVIAGAAGYAFFRFVPVRGVSEPDR